MKRRRRLKRRTPLRRYNLRRRAKLYERNFGRHADHIRTLPCVICGALPSQPAHVRSRGAGGSKRDLVPMCADHHREQHDMGIRTFEAKYEIDLADEAKRLWEGR